MAFIPPKAQLSYMLLPAFIISVSIGRKKLELLTWGSVNTNDYEWSREAGKEAISQWPLKSVSEFMIQIQHINKYAFILIWVSCRNTCCGIINKKELKHNLYVKMRNNTQHKLLKIVQELIIICSNFFLAVQKPLGSIGHTIVECLLITNGAKEKQYQFYCFEMPFSLLL